MVIAEEVVVTQTVVMEVAVKVVIAEVIETQEEDGTS